jgi:DNA-binding HxlR family transcriptional regulator
MVVTDTEPVAGADPCPLTAALNVIGGKWNLIVLYWLATGTQRFSDLRRLMPTITHKVLTASLRQLEHDGLVVRCVYPQVPPKVEYALSGHGRSALPLIEAVRQWGHEHLRQQAAMSTMAKPTVARSSPPPGA